MVSRRPLAAADILDIWDCIAKDGFDEADRWVDRLDEKPDLLATQPTIGRARDELLAGLRGFPLVLTKPLDQVPRALSTWTPS